MNRTLFISFSCIVFSKLDNSLVSDYTRMISNHFLLFNEKMPKKKSSSRKSILEMWLKKHWLQVTILGVVSSIFGIISFPVSIWSIYHPPVQTVTSVVTEYRPDPRTLTLTLTPTITVTVTRVSNNTVSTTSTFIKTIADSYSNNLPKFTIR